MMKRFINALIGLYNRTHTGSKLEIIEDVSEFFKELEFVDDDDMII